MSVYASDFELDLFDGPYQIDVACDVVRGEDVRVLLDGRSAYLEPGEAREFAAALLRKADECEASRP